MSLYRNGRKICLGGTWNNRAVDATNSRKAVGAITLPGGDQLLVAAFPHCFALHFSKHLFRQPTGIQQWTGLQTLS